MKLSHRHKPPITSPLNHVRASNPNPPYAVAQRRREIGVRIDS